MTCHRRTGTEIVLFDVNENRNHNCTLVYKENSTFSEWFSFVKSKNQKYMNLCITILKVSLASVSLFLLCMCLCMQMSEVDFLDSVLVLGFSEELNQILLQVILNPSNLSDMI